MDMISSPSNMTFRRFLLELTTDANLESLNIGAFNVMAMVSVLVGGYMTWRIAMLGGYDFFEHEVPNEMDEEESMTHKTKDRKRRGRKDLKKSRNTRSRKRREMESTRDEVEEATYVPMEIREIMAV